MIIHSLARELVLSSFQGPLFYFRIVDVACKIFLNLGCAASAPQEQVQEAAAASEEHVSAVCLTSSEAATCMCVLCALNIVK